MSTSIDHVVQAREHQSENMSPWSQINISEPKYAENSGEKCIVIDCWKYDDVGGRGDNSNVSDVSILETTIEDWLDKAPPPRSDGHEALATLRLICSKEIDSSQIPFTSSQFAAINRAFRLPPWHLHSSSERSGLCVQFRVDSALVYICRRTSFPGTITTVIRHDLTANTTVGYIIPAQDLDLETALQQIPSQFFANWHPLLLLVSMNEVELANIAAKLAAVEDDLEDVRIVDKTKHKGNQSISKHLRQMEVELSLTLNQSLQRVKLNNSFIQIQLNSLGSLISNSKPMQDLQPSSDLRLRISLLISCVEHLQMYEGLRTKIEAEQEKILAYQDVEESTHQRKIALTQQEIAKSAVESTPTDKVIVIFTTIFVPSTFVATFLTMPLFNWDAKDGEPVLNHYFYVFWAITIPLSTLILFMLTLWLRFQGIYRFKSLEYARKRGGLESP